MQPVADLVGQHVGVLERRALHPAPGGLVADDHADVVVVGVLVLDLRDVQAELLAQRDDVILVAGQEGPVGLEALPVLGKHLRRIVLRVDGDGIEKHILAQPVTEDLLYLDQLRGLQRAGIRAMGVDEVDGDDLVPDQVIEETHRLALVRGQLDVGEISGAPACCHVEGREHTRDEQGEGRHPEILAHKHDHSKMLVIICPCFKRRKR